MGSLQLTKKIYISKSGHHSCSSGVSSYTSTQDASPTSSESPFLHSSSSTSRILKNLEFDSHPKKTIGKRTNFKNSLALYHSYSSSNRTSIPIFSTMDRQNDAIAFSCNPEHSYDPKPIANIGRGNGSPSHALSLTKWHQEQEVQAPGEIHACEPCNTSNPYEDNYRINTQQATHSQMFQRICRPENVGSNANHTNNFEIMTIPRGSTASSLDGLGSGKVKLEYEGGSIVSSNNGARILEGYNTDDVWGYCLDRGNGVYTPLIPADMLPPMRGVPSTMRAASGIFVLPIPKASPPSGISSYLDKVSLLVRQIKFTQSPAFSPHSSLSLPLFYLLTAEPFWALHVMIVLISLVNAAQWSYSHNTFKQVPFFISSPSAHNF